MNSEQLGDVADSEAGAHEGADRGSGLFVAHSQSLEKLIEAIRRQLGVANRVRDVAVPEVVLYRSGLVPIIREFVTAGVSRM